MMLASRNREFGRRCNCWEILTALKAERGVLLDFILYNEAVWTDRGWGGYMFPKETATVNLLDHQTATLFSERTFFLLSFFSRIFHLLFAFFVHVGTPFLLLFLLVFRVQVTWKRFRIIYSWFEYDKRFYCSPLVPNPRVLVLGCT